MAAIDPPQIAHVASPVALHGTAERYAKLDPIEAEAAIDAFVAGAIAAWRLEDATYWHRVKFRVRLIRTMRRTRSPCGSNILTVRCENTVADDEAA